MYRMLNFTDLTKQEADKLCDDAGLTRKERHNQHGWSYTQLYYVDELCGEIAPKLAGKPFTLAVDLDRVSKAVRFKLAM